MRKETNRIEFKQQLTEDLEKESAAFLNYPERRDNVYRDKQGRQCCRYLELCDIAIGV